MESLRHAEGRVAVRTFDHFDPEKASISDGSALKKRFCFVADCQQ